MANRSQNLSRWKAASNSDRPQLAAAMALAKRCKATLPVAKLDRLDRSVPSISALMDTRGFDLTIADMPGANRLTLHVLAAAAEHERHMIGERTRNAFAAAKARGIKLGNPKQGRDQPDEGGRAGSSLASAPRALHRGRSHVEQRDRSRSQRSQHRGSEWRPMVSDASSSRPRSPRPIINREFCVQAWTFSPTAGGKHQAREALKRVAAGEPLREVALSYNVDHSTICRLKAR